MKDLYMILFHWVLVLVLSPFFVGVINKTKAFFGGRVGPPVLQPYFDIVRLFRKKCVYSRTTTWLFKTAPMVVLASFLVVSLMVPFGPLRAPLQFTGDILLVAYLLALARFFMITAALDTGYSMEGMGASREAFFSCLSELALFMNFIALSVLTKSISLTDMVGPETSMRWASFGPPLLLVVSSFFMLLLAENCRIPIDDPDTHLELTMIHEVMILDHSGVDLGYLLYGGAIKLFSIMGILVSIMFPFTKLPPLVCVPVFLAGMLAISVLIGIVESCMARLKLNRVGNFLLVAFALAFFGFIVTLWKI